MATNIANTIVIIVGHGEKHREKKTSVVGVSCCEMAGVYSGEPEEVSLGGPGRGGGTERICLNKKSVSWLGCIIVTETICDVLPSKESA